MRQYDLLSKQALGTGIILCFLISCLGGIYNFVIHVLSPFLILIEQNNMHILALYIASVSPSLIVTDIRKENKFIIIYRKILQLIRHRIPPINSLLHARSSSFSYYHTNKRGYKLKMFISYRSYIHLSNITNALIHIPQIQVRKRNRIHVPHNQ